jgi:hypothetical protein
MTNFSERRIHSAKNQNAQLCHAEIFRSGSNPTLQSLAKLEGASPDAVAPPSKTFRHSLLAIRCCFTIRHSLFAIRHRSRLGRSLALPI